MKRTGTCPSCGSDRLWRIDEVAANEDTGTMQIQPSFRLAVSGFGTQARQGALMAYACRGCGRVELYLKEPLVADGRFVHEVGPKGYRE